MAEQKRIILTVTNDLVYDQRMQKICRSLSTAGYVVELVGRVRPSSPALSNEPFKQTRLNCIFEKGKLFYIEFNLRLFFYLLFTRFDAACAIDLDTIAAVFTAGKLKSAKLVYDAHEYFTEVPEVVRRPRVKKVWQWVEKTFVPKADLIYTVGPSIAEMFSKQYGKPVHTIMNVPVLDDGRWTTDNGRQTTEKYILYQGALNEGRGLEYIIFVMKDIDCNLVIAGEGDLSNKLRALAKARYGDNKKIQFLGYVKPADLKTITANATIGINLLENKGLSYYYSLSNKFFDYIHARVPQVCIAFPEYERLNTAYTVAVLAKSCHVEEIKNTVNRLLTDHELYLLLQKNCEVCSRSLNWQVEEKKLWYLYEQLFR